MSQVSRVAPKPSKAAVRCVCFPWPTAPSHCKHPRERREFTHTTPARARVTAAFPRRAVRCRSAHVLNGGHRPRFRPAIRKTKSL